MASMEQQPTAMDSIESYAILHGMTLRQLARMLGYAPQYFSQCKKGSRPMTERMKRVLYLRTNGEVNLIDNT